MHSKTLEETLLWNIFQEKMPHNDARIFWVKNVYEAASKYLMDVRVTFKYYTLHDETHILNVLDAIAGLLGDQIATLTEGEIELLILAACLHDLGMVYADEEKNQVYEDEPMYNKFLKEYHPDLLGTSPKEWPEDVCLWYLRTLHPFRVADVLQNEGWKELFEQCPIHAVPKRCILAVCQAHGEDEKELRNNRNLDYLPANDVDPMFCAMLLRLGDYLDFDDTRAPKILLHYIANNKESLKEWKKHQASAGFRYPKSPSTDDLPYKARCTNPSLEHTIRAFLDRIDEELNNCARLQRYCHAEWQQKFPFPRAVSRDEIESEGYMSGDFCMTMDQAQILKLLTGENLYEDTDVFVRELLQNAIDATLLRAELDKDFILEESRIDFWEWNDKEGNTWIRIDDQGTGMTLGMLQRYFLKVGNSYYTSRELERDMRENNKRGRYQSISRFGIGFLSCFLCSDYAEVSTLYFDPQKNRREESRTDSYQAQTVHYGICLQVTGLNGYYTLKNQAKKHLVDGQMVGLDSFDGSKKQGIEKGGYRVKAGTSILIRLEPWKLINFDLHKAIKKYLCCSKVPVYYNNSRVGRTYKEMMEAINKMAGKKVYELTLDLKREFDRKFPKVRGEYPKIMVSVILLETEKGYDLPPVSGILLQYDVHFDKVPHWKVKDLNFIVDASIRENNNRMEVVLEASFYKKAIIDVEPWTSLAGEYGSDKTNALAQVFEGLKVCPQTGEFLGDVWMPFAENRDVHAVWRAYYEYKQKASVAFCFKEYGYPDIEDLTLYDHCGKGIIFAYKGIIAGELERYLRKNRDSDIMFFLEDDCKPVVGVSRSNLIDLPLQTIVTICAILIKYQEFDVSGRFLTNFKNWDRITLGEWRKVKDSDAGKWFEEVSSELLTKIKQVLKRPMQTKVLIEDLFSIGNKYNHYLIFYKYLITYLQCNYDMVIDYKKGQAISFHKKGKTSDLDIFDFFPPMMFCKAANSQSCRYICAAMFDTRRGITLDHPYIRWLMDNAVKLNQYYQRYFQQIVECLCHKNADDIVRECNRIREELFLLSGQHGIDIRNLPQLSTDDFWRGNNVFLASL